MTKFYITASNYNEAYNKALNEDREEIINFMINHTTNEVLIEYGEYRPINDELEYIFKGEFELHLKEFISIEDLISLKEE